MHLQSNDFSKVLTSIGLLGDKNWKSYFFAEELHYFVDLGSEVGNSSKYAHFSESGIGYFSQTLFGDWADDNTPFLFASYGGKNLD